MADSRIVEERNAEEGQAREPMVSGGLCPACQAELPLVEAGYGWCWRCGARYWAEREKAGLQLYAAVCKAALSEAVADGEGVAIQDDGTRDEIDPDGGIHGSCPLCSEWLVLWISGRCRCEACGGALVVWHRRGSNRFYKWSVDEEVDETAAGCASGRVRTAYRDDLTLL